MIKFLDTLSDEDVLKVLDWLYGQNEPIWEECSEEEYEENCPKRIKYINDCFGEGKLPTEEDLKTWSQFDYKKEPVYKEWEGGIFNLIKLQKEKEPDYYKYYKQVGTKRIVIVNSQIMHYLNQRKINYD